mmetsp:Transcript_31082/g.80970  ORF Transcript_31082/g.80970 Transcript_31082/m.80970 type:complete len:576 (+) Transcript_31082:133-1860(+)
MDEKALAVIALQQQADHLHLLAQQLMQQGRYAEAQQQYAEMHARLDESTALAKEVGCVACVLGDTSCAVDGQSFSEDELKLYQELQPVAPWGDSGTGAALECANRALGSIVGSLVADAAAMGVHWVYDLEALQHLSQQALSDVNRPMTASTAHGPQQQQQQQQFQVNAFGDSNPAAAKIAAGVAHALNAPPLEFLDPPRSPFYSYASGRNSPYGEQVLVLLQSIAKCGGLDCCQYAASFAQAFQDTNGGYRDVSAKGFLANHLQGLQPPYTGANDAQANCIVRCPPLVACWAGSPGLFPAVQHATRVTQNSSAACVWACAAAAILEAVVLTGCSPSQAVAAVAAELQQVSKLPRSQQAPTSPSEPELVAALSEPKPAALSEPEQAAVSEPKAAAIPIMPEIATQGEGGTSSRHMPEIPDRTRRFAFAGAMAAQVSAHLLEAASLAPLPLSCAVARLGRNCHMPNALQTPLLIALHLEHRLRDHLGLSLAAWDTSAATSIGYLYAEGVRLAISEGGCCASRAAFVGALLGASSGVKDGSVIPRGWEEKYRQYDAVLEHAQMICQARYDMPSKKQAV